jgi:hypothetical protein
MIEEDGAGDMKEAGRLRRCQGSQFGMKSKGLFCGLFERSSDKEFLATDKTRIEHR